MTSETRSLFQYALRELRGDESQAAMAERIGRTQVWWSYLENGKREPNLTDLEALSRLGLNLVYGQWDVAGEPVDAPSYRIDVARRNQSDNGYETDPYVASAWLGKRCVAIQYGSAPGIAFQKAWRVVQEDRERAGVVGSV